MYQGCFWYWLKNGHKTSLLFVVVNVHLYLVGHDTCRYIWVVDVSIAVKSVLTT